MKQWRNRRPPGRGDRALALLSHGQRKKLDSATFGGSSGCVSGQCVGIVRELLLTLPKGTAGKRSTSSTRSTDFALVLTARADTPCVTLTCGHDPARRYPVLRRRALPWVSPSEDHAVLQRCLWAAARLGFTPQFPRGSRFCRHRCLSEVRRVLLPLHELDH